MTLIEPHHRSDREPAAVIRTSVDPGQLPHGVSLFRILAAIVESWVLVVVTVVLAALITAGYTLSQARTYTARVVLVTVNANRVPTLGGLGAGLLSLSGGGVQATPGFVMRLMRTDTVLREVAMSRWPGGNAPLISRVLGTETAVPSILYPDRLKRLMLTGDDDKDAGTIAVSVTHPDSAVARVTVNRLVGSTISAFKRVSKAQAAELRDAQDARVDSAAVRLRFAEEARVEFTRANRTVPEFSELYIRQQQLERGLQVAQTVYGQAVSDRESAVAKELEETPALIVVDPVPAELSPNPRRLGLKLLGAVMLGFVLATAFAIGRSLLTEGAVPASDLERLRRAAGMLPRPRDAATPE